MSRYSDNYIFRLETSTVSAYCHAIAFLSCTDSAATSEFRTAANNLKKCDVLHKLPIIVKTMVGVSFLS